MNNSYKLPYFCIKINFNKKQISNMAETLDTLS